MITVKVKIHNDKLEKFLTHLQTLDSNTIESIDYKIPKMKAPKKPKIIYKPYTFDNLVVNFSACLGFSSINAVKTFKLLNKKCGSNWFFKVSNFAVSVLLITFCSCIFLFEISL